MHNLNIQLHWNTKLHICVIQMMTYNVKGVTRSDEPTESFHPTEIPLIALQPRSVFSSLFCFSVAHILVQFQHTQINIATESSCFQ